jgi:hypothetical protein
VSCTSTWMPRSPSFWRAVCLHRAARDRPLVPTPLFFGSTCPTSLETTNRVLPIVQNGDMWQVVFGLSIRNDGSADARNWRVRLVTSDGGTLMGINRALDGRNVTETFVGPGWPVLAGRHTLNFRDRPETVEVKCLLTADSMPAHEAVLRLEPEWTTMTASFR